MSHSWRRFAVVAVVLLAIVALWWASGTRTDMPGLADNGARGGNRDAIEILQNVSELPPFSLAGDASEHAEAMRRADAARNAIRMLESSS